MPLIPRIISPPTKLIPNPKIVAAYQDGIIRVVNNTKHETDTSMQSIIGQYLKTYNNIVVARINRAIATNKCLQEDVLETRETMLSKFRIKFCRAISDRTIQLSRVTPRSMNVMVQKMVNNIIVDEIRIMRRECYYCKKKVSVDECSNRPEKEHGEYADGLMNDALNNGGMFLERFNNAEHALMMNDMWLFIVKEIETYEPDKLQLLYDVVNPNIETNFSSPAIHQLRKTIVAILQEYHNAADSESDYTDDSAIDDEDGGEDYGDEEDGWEEVF